jgi:hypothetical protein
MTDRARGARAEALVRDIAAVAAWVERDTHGRGDYGPPDSAERRAAARVLRDADLPSLGRLVDEVLRVAEYRLGLYEPRRDERRVYAAAERLSRASGAIREQGDRIRALLRAA